MSNVLMEISKAERALEAASNLHQILELRDRATALHVLAEARGFQHAAQKAKIFQLRAERKAGDWLQEFGPKPGRPEGFRGELSHDDTILPDLGINRSESSRWQVEARLPEGRFAQWVEQALDAGREISAAGLRREVKGWEREQRNQEDGRAARSLSADGKLWHLEQAAVGELRLESESVTAVICDPPYPAEFLSLYDDLGRWAAGVLKPGGSLLALVGQAHLGEVISRLSRHLTYQWTLALLLSGPRSLMYQRRVNVGWKPIVWFVAGRYSGPTNSDVIEAGAPEKDRFKWQQGEFQFAELVRRFSRPGDLVADPVCGTGTTGAAAIRLGRRFSGADIDPERIANAKVRLGKAS